MLLLDDAPPDIADEELDEVLPPLELLEDELDIEDELVDVFEELLLVGAVELLLLVLDLLLLLLVVPDLLLLLLAPPEDELLLLEDP